MYKKNKQINKSRRLQEYCVGDSVLVEAIPMSDAIGNKTACFFDLYEGPYVIGEKVAPSTFRLINPINNKERGIFHANKMKKYICK